MGDKNGDRESNYSAKQRKSLTVSDQGGSGGVSIDVAQGLAPGEVIDDFEIIEEVGRGGMGVVYRASERSLRRVVALKILHPSIAGSKSAAKRFRREAILAANLSNPHIVPVFSVDENDPPEYYTMEFVQGRSLREKVEADGYLSPKEAIRIALQSCEALQYAHENNIIHRDIKPHNVLLQNHVERVRITDFGIAQDTTGNLAEMTQTLGHSFGTPAFMSPEQNLGQPLDRRTDIFSLGMTLYYMLTGQAAYTVRNRQELAIAFKDQKPKPPSRLNPDVDRRLDAIVLKMISVDPDRRYADCREVISALKGCAEATGPAARPIGERISAVCRNRLVRMTVGAAALAAIALAVTFSLIGSDDAVEKLIVRKEIHFPGIIRDWRRTLTGHWTSPEETDLFLCSGKDMFVVSTEGEIIFRHTLVKNDVTGPDIGLVLDIDGDTRPEVFTSWADGEDLVVSVQNQNRYELKRFTDKGTVYNGDGGKNLVSQLMARKVLDLDGDGDKELLARLNTGYGKEPRGIACFSMDSGELLWRHLTGGGVYAVEVMDVDSDGRNEIVFGSFATGNGNEAPDGTDDKTSYICALSNSGEPLWVRQLGGYSSAATVIAADLGGDGRKELVGWVRGAVAWHGDKDCPIVILGPKGEIMSQFIPSDKAQVLSCITADTEGDGKLRVIATDHYGRVHFLDEKLRVVTQSKAVKTSETYKDLRLVDCCDVTGDEKPEMIFISSECKIVSADNPGYSSRPANVYYHYDCRILVTDLSCNPIAEHVMAERSKRQFSPTVRVGKFRPGQGTEILVLYDKATFLSCQAE